ncbi:MAG: PilZ domain-containing protein, partial [Hyphomicrobium sp.]|nr:PilZ domain-containing protein [Hyphomicrobium sp.]
ISVSGMRLRGAAPAQVGTELGVQFDGIDVMAKVMRADADSFAVQFAPSQEMHACLVRHIYGGRYGGNVPDISAGKVAGAVLSRVFR